MTICNVNLSHGPGVCALCKHIMTSHLSTIVKNQKFCSLDVGATCLCGGSIYERSKNEFVYYCTLKVTVNSVPSDSELNAQWLGSDSELNAQWLGSDSELNAQWLGSDSELIGSDSELNPNLP